MPASKADSARSNRAGRSAGARRVAPPPAPPARGPLLPFATGLACGLAIAFLLDLREPPPREAAASAENAPAASQPPGIRFEFPDVLREAEVLVPYVEEYLRPEEPEPEHVDYLLQAGAFRSAEDADRRRAAILLLDLEARTLRVTREGTTWHRVLVGPFPDRSRVRDAQVRLLGEDIDSIVLKTEKDA
ncbi:MAG: SPOR domain-containing protein [Pseudomonadales bacterium]|nr:SPOR domain-containing protein [Pseudomonadales bacterium]